MGFPADRKYWQSIVAEVVYANDRTLKEIRLHPIAMGFGQERSKRGAPYPAPEAEAVADLQGSGGAVRALRHEGQLQERRRHAHLESKAKEVTRRE